MSDHAVAEFWNIISVHLERAGVQLSRSQLVEMVTEVVFRVEDELEEDRTRWRERFQRPGPN